MLDHRVVDTEDGENLPLSRLSYLERVVWKQNGGDSTPLTTKYERMEGRMSNVENDVVEVKNTQATTLKMFWAIIILLVGSLVAATTDIITHRSESTIQQHTQVF